MRILVTVPWGDRLGGAEAMLHTALEGARTRGHRVELVFFEPGPWADELAEAGFRVEVLRAGRLRQLHRTLATVARLTRLLRRRRPDLILNWSAKTHLYGSAAATLAGMRDRAVWWQQAIPPPRGWLDRLATRLPARAILCYSRAAAEAQGRLRPMRPTYVVAAGAPVPAEDVEPAALKLPNGPIVGLVGRLQPWKGQDRVMQAQALLRERGVGMHLLIVGGDSYRLSPGYAASLRPLAQRLGLAEQVTMTGQVPDADPYMLRMDILVNASDPEPFGIVLLEGMARGLAVVAVDSGGPGEFIEDRRTGILARSGAPDALADALEPLLASASLRDELGRAGRERFLREFTDVAMQHRFYATLEAIAGAEDEGGSEREVAGNSDRGGDRASPRPARLGLGPDD
jgi:glycosyltransferase involved in cell wall biosynthesis